MIAHYQLSHSTISYLIFGLEKIAIPNNESITKISREEGISEQTLRNWRDQSQKSRLCHSWYRCCSDDWSTQDKFLVVVETASMNETELAEYARKKDSMLSRLRIGKMPA